MAVVPEWLEDLTDDDEGMVATHKAVLLVLVLDDSYGAAALLHRRRHLDAKDPSGVQTENLRARFFAQATHGAFDRGS